MTIIQVGREVCFVRIAISLLAESKGRTVVRLSSQLSI
jgi:hypothetical protein